MVVIVLLRLLVAILAGQIEAIRIADTKFKRLSHRVRTASLGDWNIVLARRNEPALFITAVQTSTELVGQIFNFQITRIKMTSRVDRHLIILHLLIIC